MIGISFSALGLQFEAEVEVEPAYGYADAQDPPEVAFNKLTCNGLDASFMLDSEHLATCLMEAADEELWRIDEQNKELALSDREFAYAEDVFV